MAAAGVPVQAALAETVVTAVTAVCLRASPDLVVPAGLEVRLTAEQAATAAMAVTVASVSAQVASAVTQGPAAPAEMVTVG